VFSGALPALSLQAIDRSALGRIRHICRADRRQTRKDNPFRLRIYMKIFRALVSAASDCASAPRSVDARGCAKLALVSVARGAGALGGTFGVDRIDPLIAILDELSCGLEQRFPDARAFVRPGLDCPVA